MAGNKESEEFMTKKDWEIVKSYGFMAIFTTIFLLIVLIGLSHAQNMDLTKAVIHHTASHDVSAKEIDRWHKERGWDGIGYHFLIRKNGDIEKGRPLYKQGAHAKGRNNWIGIALTGYDKFTKEQIASLKALIKKLKIKYIEPHHEKCPGSGINLKEIL